MRAVKNFERGWEHSCFPIMAMSLSLFRKGTFQLVDHPPRSDDPPVDLGREDSISSFFLNSQILNQKPQTKAICSLSCCVWSCIWTRQEEGPQTKNHTRGCFTLLWAPQQLKQNVDSDEITGHYWRSHFRSKNQENVLGFFCFFLKTHKRYETSMILVRVGQDQTYPSLMKECKQQSSRWCESEWSNVAWILNIHNPHAGKDITHPPLRITLPILYWFSRLHQDCVLSWQRRWYENSRQAVTLARMETPMPCSDDS